MSTAISLEFTAWPGCVGRNQDGDVVDLPVYQVAVPVKMSALIVYCEFVKPDIDLHADEQSRILDQFEIQVMSFGFPMYFAAVRSVMI